MSFYLQVDKARELGDRMQRAGFTDQDNPYTHLNPHLARVWTEGFTGATIADGIKAALFNRALDYTQDNKLVEEYRRKHPNLVKAWQLR